ncbi:MAG: BREX-4 system phosphatase PglZ [Lachnospiraceae bacterium]|nr:BREX-4 system phosphatase PglZ [Lachnospiraceae bacterium]
MTLEKIEKHIEMFLASDKRWPIIVDFSNKEDLKNFVYHFSVGSNTILFAGNFCGKDGTIKLEELLNRIENNTGNIFLTHISSFLKLYGENEIKRQLKTIISKSIKGHVVIVTYQCRNFIRFSDSRFNERGQILTVDGDFDEISNICLISPDLAAAFKGSYSGFEKTGEALETSVEKTIYIATDVKKQMFNMSVINISQLSNGYDILCSKDSRIKNVPESFGEPEQWNRLLKEMGANNISYVVDHVFGSEDNLIECVKKYPTFNDEKKWIFYILLCILGTKKSAYLSHVLLMTSNYQDIPKAIYRGILSLDKDDADFEKIYNKRKEFLTGYVDYLDEAVDYCKIVSTKQADSIYFLTDVTQPEREKIIEWLGVYGSKYDSTQLIQILGKIYPDLAAYLSNYRFKKEFLNTYFEKYKYQKVINKVLPTFETVVEDQAIKLDFVSLLPARTNVFDKIDLVGARVFFFDSLGVEYLGYIQSKCNEYGLSANITCTRSELPTLTCFNREFVDVCTSKGCKVTDIKDLDEIKHHGEDSFDYEKPKTPIYLIKELEIIDNALKVIRGEILSSQYTKAVIVSDHGASRLAVLHETENLWQMETKGMHSGRCCPKNEINEKPSFAIEANDYWVLANYDRFKGSRKANVEVHGGATIEEVTVPIIEITRKVDGIEAWILDEYKVITLGAMEVPTIKFYVGVVSNNISIKVEEKYYDAHSTPEKYIYSAKLDDCVKKGTYIAEIIYGSETLSSGNTFEIKKKGMTEVSLFD